MLVSVTRRAIMAASVMTVPALLAPRVRAAEHHRSVEARLADLETRSRGRLGVAVLNVATDQLIGNRANERFAMCSTFKALAVAFVLARVDRGEERLDRRITFSERDLVPPFTATKPHVGFGGMTVAELCEGAITVSDSTAANLLLTTTQGMPPRAVSGSACRRHGESPTSPVPGRGLRPMMLGSSGRRTATPSSSRLTSRNRRLRSTRRKRSWPVLVGLWLRVLAK